MPVEAIGPFQFVEMVGVPDLPEEQLEVIQRAGVDGSAYRKTGLRGEPFSVVTRVDVLNQAAGHLLLFQYKELKKQGVQVLVHRDTALSIVTYYVVVLRVRPIRLRSIGTSVGGLLAAPGAWLEAEWTLIGHKIP